MYYENLIFEPWLFVEIDTAEFITENNMAQKRNGVHWTFLYYANACNKHFFST